MEASGVALRPSPCFSGVGFNTQSSKLSFNSTNLQKSCGALRVSNQRSRNFTGVSSLGFSDSGHVLYYVSPKADLKEKEKKQRKDSESKALKKKLKLVKGMSKNLLRFSSMGLEDGLIGDKKISEATEILLAQLQQLKAEEKELKRQKKEEKAKLRAARIESSSSSSESSDSVGGEVVNMASLRAEAIAEVPPVSNQISLNADVSFSGSGRSEESVKAAAGKIEICMGGKCKKSGAPALLEEFQQRVGIEGAVVGCKCMGKCRDAPNVRIVNQMEDGVSPLCIGVGLDDVSTIVGNFFGGERKELELLVA